MKAFLHQFKDVTRTSRKARSHGEASATVEATNTSLTRRENVEKALDITIQTIDSLKTLIPIDIAKNILTGISSILVLLQKSFENKDSLRDLTRHCEDICSHLALATKGVSVDRMRRNDALKKALDELESSVSDLRERVNEALGHGTIRGVIAAKLDEKDINAWTGELDMIRTSFGLKLNIVTALRVEDIYDLLKRSDVSRIYESYPRSPPPAPALFFGRDQLLSGVKQALLRDEDIALIGPGGIGKSSLAKAVINDEDIKKRYRRRFFVSYDGMDCATITFDAFIQRIASTLGLHGSGGESGRQVRLNLESSPVLLVLDNAETFEEVVSEGDATRISTFVADIATTSGVTVMLTSRTRENAPNVDSTRFKVPPLDKEPARQYFRKIYHGEIDDDSVDILLGTVNRHPLSIHILAYTAEVNEWTGKRLLGEWEVQQSKMLQRGHGKQNFGFTIRLSLDSPSIKALGNDCLNILWIIAFLPQGVNEHQAPHLFPTICYVSSVLDTLCRVSLAHRSGPFVTILAPIRLFLLDSFPNVGLGLLKDVRSTYYSSLQNMSEKKDLHAELLISDDLNIERLIAFDIAHSPNDVQDTTFFCCRFLTGLRLHRPRPTLLAPAIISLPESSFAEQEAKAQCLDDLAYLYHTLSNGASAGLTSIAANTLFTTIGNHTKAALCIYHGAMSYNDQGYFLQAQKIMDDFMRSSSWENIDEQHRKNFYFALDYAKMHTSCKGVDKLFLRSIDHEYRGLQSHVFHWRARVLHAYSTPEEAEKSIEPVQSLCMSSSNPWICWSFLETVVATLFLQKRLDAAMQLLCETHDSMNVDFQVTLRIRRDKAAVASEQGNYELARSLLKESRDDLDAVATPSFAAFLDLLYVQGRNELYAQNYWKAREPFLDVIMGSQHYLLIKMLCTRALGEVEILLGHNSDSERHFSQTIELCKEAGVPHELFGIGVPLIKLDDDRFPGWRKFLKGKVGSSQIEGHL